MKCRTFCGAPMEDGGAYCSKCGRRFSWPLTLSVVACTRIRLLSAINGLLAGGLPGAVFGDVCSLIFIVFLFGMLFPALECCDSGHRHSPERGIETDPVF